MSSGTSAASATFWSVLKSDTCPLIQALSKAGPQPKVLERSLPVPRGMMETAGAGAMLERMMVCTSGHPGLRLALWMQARKMLQTGRSRPMSEQSAVCKSQAGKLTLTRWMKAADECQLQRDLQDNVCMLVEHHAKQVCNYARQKLQH